MSILNTSSIRTRLKLVILFISFVSVLLVFGGLFAYEYFTYNEMLGNDLSSKADIISENSTAALSFRDSSDATQILASLVSQPRVTSGAIYDSFGKLFVAYQRGARSGVPPGSPLPDGVHYGDTTLIASRPIFLRGERIGTTVLVMDLKGRVAHFTSYVQIAFLVLLGSLVVAFVVATKLERTISGPILELAATAKNVSQSQDYTIRAAKTGKDETALLADAVNEMMSQIQVRDENLRQANEVMGNEIAERIRVEGALRSAETQLRLITEATPLMLTRCNKENQFVYVNRAYADTFNLSHESIIGKRVEEIMGRVGYEPISRYVKLVLRGDAVNFETEIKLERVGSRFLSAAFVPDKNEQGEVVGWFGSMSDITDSKLADQALRASEERFRQFMSNLPGAAWIKDRQGEYVYANEEACRIFGHTRSELYGKSDKEIFPPETAFQFIENDRKAMESGTGMQSIETLLHEDGMHHSIVTKFPVLGPDGEPMFIGGIAIDITQRKRAEEALHESEERTRLAQARLAAIVESSQDAIIGKTLDGMITSWNSGAENIFGYSSEEMIGRNVTDLIPGDRLHEEKGIMERLRRGDSIEHFDTVRLTKEGKPVDVSLTISPIRESSGNIIGASKIARDITERKKSEEELQKAHNELEMRVKERTAALVKANDELQKRDIQLSAAQQIAHLGSWEWDVQTSRVTWSDELYRIYGLHAGEFGGTVESFLEYVHPGDRSIMLSKLQEALTTHEPFSFEERIIRPDGSIRILESQGRVVTQKGGEIIKLHGVCLDITDRKLADEKFRGLLESAPDAMVIMDEHEKIVRVNEQTERLFGYSRDELLGRSVELLLPKGFGKENGRSSENHGNVPGSPFHRDEIDLYGCRKDKTTFPVEISLSPLETEDGPVILSAIRDVSEQKQLRALLVEAERRRSVDLRRYVRSVQRVQEEERQRIARELHDDLCQRLSGMKLNIEVVADEFREKDRSLHRKLLSFNKQCENAITEVRRMSVNLRPSVLDDFGLITALGLLAREFEKQHKIRVKMDMDSSIRLLLDSQLEIALYRITQEALTNIAKYAHASGVVLSIRKTEESVILSISDDGKGFNLADISRPRDPNTGLGLIGMRERTELFGGKFTIQSVVSEGTTILVTIPLNIGKRNEEDALTYR